MAYEDTNCPCVLKKPTDTMLCDACHFAFLNRRELEDYQNPGLSFESRRQAAVILVPLARGCSRPRSEAEMASMLARWRDRILKSVGTAIDNHYLDGPVEDQTDEERGFERGLETAITEICKLMDDPRYFGRSPQNDQVEARREVPPNSSDG